jgi:hypothetical protein
VIGDHVDDPSDYKETHNILGDAKSLNNPITRRAKTFGESASCFLSTSEKGFYPVSGVIASTIRPFSIIFRYVWYRETSFVGI